MPARGAQLLDPLLDHGEVGERELELELLDVAPRVHAQERVRHGVVLEGAHDVEQRIGVAQPGQLVGGDVPVGGHASRDRGRRQVDVGDVGGDLAAWLEERRQAREALVRDLHDARVDGQPAEAAGLARCLS